MPSQNYFRLTIRSCSADKRLFKKSYFRLHKRLLIDTHSNADRVAKRVSESTLEK